jgi:hypothetical protein
MVIIKNDINQEITWLDDRVEAEKSNPVIYVLTHTATNKSVEIATMPFDATELYNGGYSCSVIDTITSKLITSFTVKVIDIKSLSLTENERKIDLNYAKNR